jgi:diguanylate cyclase (GGDEF)-like protein/PAS domain S-box-containing protein
VLPNVPALLSGLEAEFPSGATPGVIRRELRLQVGGEERQIELSLMPVRAGGDRTSGRIALLRDVTEQRAVERRLRDSEERHRLMAEQSEDVIWTMDPIGRIEYVSPAIQRLLGYTPEALRRLQVSDLLAPESLAEGNRALALLKRDSDTDRGAASVRIEAEQIRRDGTRVWTEITASRMSSDTGEFLGVLGITRDISARREAQQALVQVNQELRLRLAEIEALQGQLREQAIRDPVSGLYNRRFLDESLAREVARAERTGAPLSLAMLDLDHFKLANDFYGHVVGDDVIQTLASRLLTTTRRGDIVCRYGGEEFVVIMPDATLDELAARVDQWRSEFADTLVSARAPDLRVTFSAGVASCPAHGRSAEELMAAADRALYAAKRAGRNRVVKFGALAAIVSSVSAEIR